MKIENQDLQAHVVLGQKYAFATASLMLGITSYIHILGMEKAILAIVFAWLALRQSPSPVLTTHRSWAKAGLVLGALLVIVLPTFLLLNLGRIHEIVDALNKLQTSK